MARMRVRHGASDVPPGIDVGDGRRGADVLPGRSTRATAPPRDDTVDPQRRTISFLVAAVRPSTVSSNMGKTSRMRRMVVAP